MTDLQTPAVDEPVDEKQGRRWIFGSFLLCPCHLPITLAILGSLAGGTVIGGLLRDHALLAGVAITAGWLAGTANGFRLVRHAQRGTCPVPLRQRLPELTGHDAGTRRSTGSAGTGPTADGVSPSVDRNDPPMMSSRSGRRR